MIDPRTIAEFALGVAIFVSLTKFLLPGPASQSADDQSRQAQLVRLYVYLVSAAACALFLPFRWSQDYLVFSASLKGVLIAAFEVGTASIASYHLVTGLPANLIGIAGVATTLEPFAPEKPLQLAPSVSPEPAPTEVAPVT